MSELNNEEEFKINIYNWKGENRTDVEIVTDSIFPIELNFESVREAREFIKKLQQAKIYKYKVNQDGSVE